MTAKIVLNRLKTSLTEYGNLYIPEDYTIFIGSRKLTSIYIDSNLYFRFGSLDEYPIPMKFGLNDKFPFNVEVYKKVAEFYGDSG